jgi:hypothetical protein
MEFASGNGNKKEAQTVLAQSAGAFEMSWNLDGKAVSDVLGPTILCKWRVRIGQEERTLEIKMQRKD